MASEKARQLTTVEETAQHIGRMIGNAMPPGWGFALVTFTFGEGGYVSYISNAEREDMVRALRECADKLESRKDFPPGVAGRLD